MLSWLICSVNSFSSMVSVRGTDKEKRLLKFFILFMVLRGADAGGEGERTAQQTWISTFFNVVHEEITHKTADIISLSAKHFKCRPCAERIVQKKPNSKHFLVHNLHDISCRACCAAVIDLYVPPDQRQSPVSPDNEVENSRITADQYTLSLSRLHNHSHPS